MPRNVLFAAKRGKVDFKACPEHLPAVGAETLEDGVVRRDVPADLLGRLGVELGIEGERYVDDAAARGADDMRMRLDRVIEAAAARRLDGEDLAGVGQEIEIAVDRTAADFVILRARRCRFRRRWDGYSFGARRQEPAFAAWYSFFAPPCASPLFYQRS